MKRDRKRMVQLSIWICGKEKEERQRNEILTKLLSADGQPRCYYIHILYYHYYCYYNAIRIVKCFKVGKKVVAPLIYSLSYIHTHTVTNICTNEHPTLNKVSAFNMNFPLLNSFVSMWFFHLLLVLDERKNKFFYSNFFDNIDDAPCKLFPHTTNLTFLFHKIYVEEEKKNFLKSYVALSPFRRFFFFVYYISSINITLFDIFEREKNSIEYENNNRRKSIGIWKRSVTNIDLYRHVMVLWIYFFFFDTYRANMTTT